MKLRKFKEYFAALLLLGYCGSGWAVVYPTPDPLPMGATVGADDGSELFALGDSIWTFELLDAGEGLPILEFEFGYYFGSDAADGTVDTFYSIFGKNEATNQKTVNIGSTDPIGFYLQSDAVIVNSQVVAPATNLFTQAILNDPLPDANGVDETDWAAAYPVLTAPDPVPVGSYLLAFYYPVPQQLGGDGTVIPIYASVAGPSPIPLPGAIFLWLTGLAGLALFRRSLASGSPVTAIAAR
jgi:hypothetical protein